MIAAALVLPDTMSGMTEASTTCKPDTPFTRRRPSTTARSSGPMRHVLVGWKIVEVMALAPAVVSSPPSSDGPGLNSWAAKGRKAGAPTTRRIPLMPATAARRSASLSRRLSRGLTLPELHGLGPAHRSRLTCAPVRTVRLGRFSAGRRRARDVLSRRPFRRVTWKRPTPPLSPPLKSPSAECLSRPRPCGTRRGSPRRRAGRPRPTRRPCRARRSVPAPGPPTA